jgi:hypothetical protein
MKYIELDLHAHFIHFPVAREILLDIIPSRYHLLSVAYIKIYYTPMRSGKNDRKSLIGLEISKYILHRSVNDIFFFVTYVLFYYPIQRTDYLTIS